MTSLFRKLDWLVRGRVKEDELEKELQFHLDEEAEERQAAGLSAEEAYRAARFERAPHGVESGRSNSPGTRVTPCGRS